ncbi:hypothetical protein EYF80_060385 [Liparis tanakae]|uniref:Uncharacterized protein n=1 Tax=Liparis tanakae TaxID=230148 RepID=A0A4Z2EKP9_9TELE|nr:hypothetical protein EYF80_060385 [Liparis tanakae]
MDGVNIATREREEAVLLLSSLGSPASNKRTRRGPVGTERVTYVSHACPTRASKGFLADLRAEASRNGIPDGQVSTPLIHFNTLSPKPFKASSALSAHRPLRHVTQESR